MEQRTITAGWQQFGKCLLVLLMLVGAFLFWPFCYGWVSVCSTCGRTNHVLQCQLPLMPIPWFTQTEVRSTPLSNFADTILTDHEHQWQFIHGNGNGMMGSGAGLVIDWAISSEDAIIFLRDAREYDGDDDSRLWLSRFLDPDTSKPARFAAVEFGIDGQFEDEATYREHRKRADAWWEEEMNRMHR